MPNLSDFLNGTPSTPQAAAPMTTAATAPAATPYASLLNQAAQDVGLTTQYGLTGDNFLSHVVHQESSFNPNAVSPSGAAGLMQLMPATASRFGATDPHDPVQNVYAGARYLRFLLDRFHGNVPAALAGYNAGEGHVTGVDANGMPILSGQSPANHAQTQHYVGSILQSMGGFQPQVGTWNGQPLQQGGLQRRSTMPFTVNSLSMQNLPMPAQVNYTPPANQSQKSGGLFTELWHGAVRGTLGAAADLGSGLSALGNATGSDALQQIGNSVHDYWNHAAQPYAPAVGSINDIHSAGNFADWAAGKLGEMAPGAAQFLVGGWLGKLAAEGALGAVEGGASLLGKDAAASAIQTYAKRDALLAAAGSDAEKAAIARQALAGKQILDSVGTHLGGAAAFYPTAVGSAYDETQQAGQPSGGLALGLGVPMAAVGALPGAKFLDRTGLLQNGVGRAIGESTLGGMAKGALEQGLLMPAANLANEEMLIREHQMLDPNYDPNSGQAWDRRLNAAASGAVGGVLMGGAEGLFHPQAPAQPSFETDLTRTPGTALTPDRNPGAGDTLRMRGRPNWTWDGAATGQPVGRTPFDTRPQYGNLLGTPHTDAYDLNDALVPAGQQGVATRPPVYEGEVLPPEAQQATPQLPHYATVDGEFEDRTHQKQIQGPQPLEGDFLGRQALPPGQPLLPGSGPLTLDGEVVNKNLPRPNLPAPAQPKALPHMTADQIDQAAHEAATSPLNDRAEPTEAQQDAGNYAKEHVQIHGMDISIENPVGSTRSGMDAKGKRWSQQMVHHYGYIRGMEGADKDHLDAFIGPNPNSQTVYVIHQKDPQHGFYDEAKAILGANSAQQAKDIYHANYAKGWKGYAGMEAMPVEAFKERGYAGDFAKIPSDLADKTRAAFGEASTGQKPFDSAAWHKERDDRIQASREAGNVHLDQVPASVETMRGKDIHNVHDPKEKGVVRTVANTGDVVVHWADPYSAEKNLATEKTEGNKKVHESWLAPSDLKDYVFSKEGSTSKDGATSREVATIKDPNNAGVKLDPISNATYKAWRDGGQTINGWTLTRDDRGVPGLAKHVLVSPYYMARFDTEAAARAWAKDNRAADFYTKKSATPKAEAVKAKSKAKETAPTVQVVRQDMGEGRREFVVYDESGKIHFRDKSIVNVSKRINRRGLNWENHTYQDVGRDWQPGQPLPHPTVSVDQDEANRRVIEHLAKAGQPQTLDEIHRGTGVKQSQVLLATNHLIQTGKGERDAIYYPARYSLKAEAQPTKNLPAPPHEDFRVTQRGGQTYLVPPVGKGWTKDMRDGLRDWLRNAGYFVSVTGDHRLAVNATENSPSLAAIEGRPVHTTPVEAFAKNPDATVAVETPDGFIPATDAADVKNIVKEHGNGVYQGATDSPEAAGETHRGAAAPENGAGDHAAGQRPGQPAVDAAGSGAEPGARAAAESQPAEEQPAGPGAAERDTGAVHVEDDGSQPEEVTPDNIAHHLVEADVYSGDSDRQRLAKLKEGLLKKIDAALQGPFDEGPKSKTSRFVTFDVPGDGKFKMQNTKERLTWFRKEIDKAKGFTVTKRPGAGSTAIGGNVMDDFFLGYKEGNYDDALNAYEMAQLKGQPLKFSITRDGPAPWHSAEEVHLGDWPGQKFFVGRGVPEGKQEHGSWRVIHEGSGMAIGDAAGSKEAAVRNAKARMAEIKDKDFMRAKMERMTNDARDQGLDPEQREQKWLDATRAKAESPEALGGEKIKTFLPHDYKNGQDDRARTFEKGQMVYIRDANGKIKSQIVTRLDKDSNLVGLSDTPTGEIRYHDPFTIESENPEAVDSATPAKAQPTEASATEATASPAKAKAKPAQKLEDFGAKIGGARKDAWAARGLKTSDLEGMTEREQFEHTTKDNVWPKPDYEKLVADGMPAEVAAVLKKMRDALPVKPEYSKRTTSDAMAKNRAIRENYIEAVNRLRTAAESLKSLDQFRKSSHFLYQVFRDKEATGTYTWSDADLALASAIGNKALKAMQLSQYDLRKIARQVQETGWPSKQELWQKRYRILKTGHGDYIVTKPRGHFIEGGPFQTEKEAADWARAAVEKNKAQFEEPTRPQLAHIERTGTDYRGGKDVTTDQFMQAFGFRGGEFGNWNSQADRQQSLNHAYDALMDLANALGVPPRALSLNGQLGMAFGARGKGRALAHYEPHRIVINLTKMSGAGSLAHEWAHALDDYFGRLSQDRSMEQPYTSHGVTARSQLRPAMLDAWNHVMQTLKTRTKEQAETIADLKAARVQAVKSMESWLRASRAALDKAAPDQVAEWDRLQTELADTGRQDTFDQMQALYQKATGRKMDKDAREQVPFRMARIGVINDNIQKALNGDLKQTANSHYLEASKKIDAMKSKPYWATPHEMFARAFETYIHDKIADTGNRSDYLVHGVDEAHWENKDYHPYPMGEERGAINRAFDAFVHSIETKEEGGNTAMFRKGENGQGLDRDTLDTHLQGIVRNWKNAPRVKVVQSWHDLPLSAHAAALRAGADMSENGFEHNGTVYLIADNNRSLHQAETTLFHEALGHYGLKGLFGKRLDHLLRQVWEAKKNDDLMARVIHDYRHVYDVNTAKGRLGLAEEYLAYTAEKNQRLPLWRKIVATVAQLARRIGFNFKLRDSEIASMLHEARNYVTEGEYQNFHQWASEKGIPIEERAVAMANRKSSLWMRMYRRDMARRSTDDFELPRDPESVTTKGGPGDQATADSVAFGKSHPQELKDQAVAQYQDGKSATQVAQELGITPHSVLSWVRAAGIEPRPYEPQQPRVAPETSPETLAKIAELYNGGKNYRDIRNELNVATATINRALQEHGIEARPKGTQALDEAIRKEAQRLYRDEDLSAAQVAQRLSISAATAQRIVSDAGLTRSPSERMALREQNRTSTPERGISMPWQSSKTGEWNFAHSSYEAVRMHQLDNDPNVLHWEKAKIRIPYGDGKTYIPDLDVEYKDGRRVVEEVKPDWRVNDPDVQAKAEAARAYLNEKGIGYRMVSEKDIGHDAMANFDWHSLPHLSDEQKQRLVEQSRYRQQRQQRQAAIEDADTSAKFRRNIIDELQDSDFFKSDKKVKWWDRYVMPMIHMAHKHAGFQKVFTKGQDFLHDTWRYATQGKNLAGDWFGTVPLSPKARRAALADRQAVGDYLFHGTLNNHPFTRDELLAGVDGLKPLTPHQADMFEAARDTVFHMLDETARAAIDKLVRPAGIHGIEDGLSIDDHAAEALNRLDSQITDAHATIMALQDLAQNDPKLARRLVDAQERLQQLHGMRDAVTEQMNHLDRLKNEGYFPLSRFGRHYVLVRSKDHLTGEPITQHFELFDGLTDRHSQIQANKAARRLRAQYPGAEVTTGLMKTDEHVLYDGLNTDALELFAKRMGLDQDSAYQSVLREALSQRSLLKRLLHRQGTPGFSTDVARGLANFTLQSARQIATIRNMADMIQSISKIQEGDVHSMAVKLLDYLRTPREEAHTLRGLMFTQFLGGSVASAVTNMTQVPLVAAPWLAQFGGAGLSFAHLSRAWLETLKASRLPRRADEREAMQRAAEDGITASQDVWNMMGISMGNRLAQSNQMQGFARAWGSLFAYAEELNRRATFLAAYRMARDNPHFFEEGHFANATTRAHIENWHLTNPYDFAAHAVNETQFIYNKGNKPGAARGVIGSTLFTFKTFNLNILSMLRRLPVKQQGYMLALLGVAAGTQGLPFAQDLEDIVDAAGQALGYNTNSKAWLDAHLKQIFGEWGGDSVLHGLASNLFGVDITSRLAMGNLIPGTAALKSTEHDKMSDMEDFFGPAYEFGAHLLRGAGDVWNGEYKEAAKTMTPTAVANAVKAADWAAGDAMRDRKGRLIAGQAGPLQIAEKAMGFNPWDLAQGYDNRAMIVQDATYLKDLTGQIETNWAKGILENDASRIDAARQALVKWNQAHPDQPIVIRRADLARRVREGLLSSNDRTVRTLPKQLRANAIIQLEQHKGD